MLKLEHANASGPIYFARVWTKEDAEKILKEIEYPYEQRELPAPCALLIDVPATEGSLALCVGLRAKGWEIIIKDHHYPEGNSERDAEIRQLSNDIAVVIQSPITYRRKRSEHPGCSTLLQSASGSIFQLIVADKDPDGLLTTMKALGLDYPGLDSDCALIDGPPQDRTQHNMTRMGWLLNCCWQALKTRDPKTKEEDEMNKNQLFISFIEACRWYHDEDDQSFNEEYEAMVRFQQAFIDMRWNAINLAETALKIGDTGWFVIENPDHIVFDRGELTRLLEKYGAKVIVNRHNHGPIADLFGSVYSASTTSLGKDVNLTEYKPADIQSDPKNGISANVPFLLHMSPGIWEQRVMLMVMNEAIAK